MGTETETSFGLTVLGEGDNMAIEKSITFTLEVLPAADLFCEVSPAYLGVRKGRVATFEILVRSLNGFAGTVDVTVTGLASPITASVGLGAGEEGTIPIVIDTAAITEASYTLHGAIVGTEI